MTAKELDAPVMDYEEAGKLAYAEDEVIIFYADPTMDKYAAHPDGHYVRLSRPVEPKAQVESASVEETEEEREMLKLIDERDAAEDAVGDIYAAVTGNQAEWSNLFGYSEAINEVHEVMQDLRSQSSKANAGLCACTGPGQCLGTSPKFRCRSDVHAPYAEEPKEVESGGLPPLELPHDEFMKGAYIGKESLELYLKTSRKSESWERAVVRGCLDYHEKYQASLLREKELRDLLKSAVIVAQDAYTAWNHDQDMKCGKILLALAGSNKGYRADTDAIQAAVTGE